MGDKILITGAGVVSAIGNDKSQVLHSLLNGKTGIGHVQYLHTTHPECPVAEVKMSDLEMKKSLSLGDDIVVSRTALMSMMALREALSEAGLKNEDCSNISLINSTTVGGIEKTETFYKEFLAGAGAASNGVSANGEASGSSLDGSADGAASDNSEYAGIHDCGATTELLSDYFGGFSFSTTISTACSSAANAIIFAARLIKSGRADIVIAGGSECLSNFHICGFNSLMILDNELCRPFDATRAGLNLGEGAGYIVLESEASAASRKARPLAVLSGYGNSCDAFHQTASSPEGNGAYLAMKKAIDMSGLKVSEIDYINAHGTGTPNNDASESRAIQRIFSDKVPPVSSTKSFTGHTTSACGVIDAVICMLALDNGFIPSNLNWKEADENCVLPYVGNDRNLVLKNVLCNSFGFGGNDSSLLISRI